MGDQGDAEYDMSAMQGNQEAFGTKKQAEKLRSDLELVWLDLKSEPRPQ